MEPEQVVGAAISENWRAFLSGASASYVYEFPVFTDASITGVDECFGPYRFFNTIAHAWTAQMALKPAMFVRIADHRDLNVNANPIDITRASGYVGVPLKDEIAAIVSLALGIRAQSGAITREFRSGDPSGRPVAYGGFGEPTLTRGTGPFILPSAISHRGTSELKVLASIPNSPATAVVALVRASLMYQDALWICESSPSLAWLLLVSALECCANQWKTDQRTAIERFREASPEIFALIESRNPELVRPIAEEFAHLLKSTEKFLSFVLEFFPDAPPQLPHPNLEVTWTEENLESVLRKVYRYRSKALHEGTPFPDPMCYPPSLAGGHLPERPQGGRIGASQWVADDVPISFHTFEYIARGTILNWWRAAAGRSE